MKRIILILFGVILLGGLVGSYFYFKPTESLLNKKPVATVTADSIFSAYEINETEANSRFLDKVIVVTGKVQAVNTDTSGTAVTLGTTSGMFGVMCKLDEKHTGSDDFQVGQQVKLKGQCTGYLMDVVLIRCVAAE